MADELSICVFCGFAAGDGPQYLASAGELGALLGERGHRLVYGAGAGGLMGAVATGVASRDGSIVGIIPEFLRAREQADEIPEQHLVLTADLLERKRRMIELSDAFIALPGGYGTLDEVVEVVSMAALGVLTSPIVLVDVNGAWQPFLAMVNALHGNGFLRDTGVFTVVDSPSAAVDHVERQLSATASLAV